LESIKLLRFFVISDLARNKTGSVKDGMTELYKNDKQKTCIQLNKIKENQNVSRTCYFKILEGITISTKKNKKN
jgi:hypothetical protein